MMMKLILSSLAAAATAAVGTALAGNNPIKKVVGLLEDLAAKAEAEFKAEEKAFLRWKCWNTKTTKEKEESNAEATTTIESLRQFIADVEAGRVEFTGERKERQEELDNITAEMQQAEADYQKQLAENQAALEETAKGVTALGTAISTISKGSKPAASMIQQSSMVQMSKDVSQVRQVMALAAPFLTLSQQQTLSTFLKKQPAEKDWEQLNKDPEFMKKYEARSGDIMGVLHKMAKTFGDKKTELEAAISKNAEEYDTLKAAKGDEKATAEQALAELAKENGAKGMSLQQSKDEVDRLEAQVSDDSTLVQEMKQTLDTKTQEFSARKSARIEEMNGIHEAVATLHSDDARDTFKASYESQGYDFLQEGSTAQLRRRKAFRVLKAVLRKKRGTHGVLRAESLISTLSRAGAGIQAVLDAIDKMVTAFEAKGTEDLAKKEQCERDLFSALQDAKAYSAQIDDGLASVERNSALIEELTTKIEKAEEKKKATGEAKDEAEANYEKTKEEHQKDSATDAEAVRLIKLATEQLQKFHKEPTFLQKGRRVAVHAHRHQRREEPKAGEPKLGFEGEYKGMGGEHKGITAILKSVLEDVEKDIAAGDKEFLASEQEWLDFKQDSINQMGRLTTAIGDFENARAGTQTDIGTSKGGVGTQRASLEATKSLYKSLRGGGCDFLAVNFETRKANQQAEVDGLKKAKAILAGADFS